MQTIWIPQKKLSNALSRNEAFWKGQLEEYPLMWVTVPNAKASRFLPEPEDEQKMWTDIDYVLAAAENQLSCTYYAGDSLPVFNPWIGPDQFASWLGAETEFKPKENTAWVKPFVNDWNKYPQFTIKPDNKYWKLYLDTVKASVEAGKNKWVTAYPDLHTGIDGLSAIRGRETLLMEMLTIPHVIHKAMQQMTSLWKYVVDIVSDIILPAGQGTSNWSAGWSEKRYLCIGQNDFTCMISPKMFVDFCLQDNHESCAYVDYSLYHLDGPDAIRHLPKLLELENLNSIQWVQGSGHPAPSQWLDMLRQIQKAGKSIQLWYWEGHGDEVNLKEEIEILCSNLDPTKLFLWISTIKSPEEADAIVDYTRQLCQKM